MKSVAQAMLQTHVTLAPWPVPVDATLPQVHVLSNGRYSTLITSAGGGYSQWQGRGLTRWQADTTSDAWGTWIYLQDQDSGAVWSAGYQPTRVTPTSQQVLFYPHQAEFQRRDHDIALHMQSFLIPQKDGSLELPYDKIYGLTHLSLFILKKFKKKVYEKDVVYLIFTFQIILCLISLIIFRQDLFKLVFK